MTRKCISGCPPIGLSNVPCHSSPKDACLKYVQKDRRRKEKRRKERKKRKKERKPAFRSCSALFLILMGLFLAPASSVCYLWAPGYALISGIWGTPHAAHSGSSALPTLCLRAFADERLVPTRLLLRSRPVTTYVNLFSLFNHVISG